MASKKESARTTIILALISVVIGGCALFFGLQTLVFFEARHWAEVTPFLQETPHPLSSTIASPIREKDLSFYGFQFGAPWKGIAKTNSGDAQSEIDFTSGPVLLFFNPDGEKNIVGSIREGDPETLQKYEVVFGPDIFSSNYALYLAVYSASPAALSPFMPRDEAVRDSTLLQWKLAFGVYGASAIYTLQTGDNRGLQFGDPSRDRVIVVRLFNTHDQQMRLLFTSKTGQPGTFSQADINGVIDSIQPVFQTK